MRPVPKVSRREFLQRAPLGIALTGAVPGFLAAATPTEQPDFCVVLANHWSYTGIGWSSGLKSCAQSIANCLDMADYTPSVKTCINLDALAYEMLERSNPEVVERLKPYLKSGKVEIIGGSYGQPMGSMASGESNLRQLVIGQQTIQKSLGVPVISFLEEEEFTHPQLPQLLRGCGYRFASTAQCNTWGKHGSPRMDRNAFLWCSPDGTSIPATPLNALVFHPPAVTHDIDWLWSDDGRRAISKLQPLGIPLAIKWVEFGWGPHELEGLTNNKFYATKFRQLSDHFRVRYTTLGEYLATYGNQAKDRVCWKMDDFQKLEPWGVGGDQLRREGRETEALLLAAERFDAFANLLSLTANHSADLTESWKHLLIAQSHDVSLCQDLVDTSASEPKEWLTDPAVKEFISATGSPEENKKVDTWGTLGFRHLQVGKSAARKTLDAAVAALAAAVNTTMASPAETSAIVFNSCGTARGGLVSTHLPQRDASERLVVRDAEGNSLASQVLALESETGENSSSVELVFAAQAVPSFGYSTYYIGRTASTPPQQQTDLKTSATGYGMENEFVSVQLDARTGAIAKLIDKRHGNDLVDSHRAPFPVFKGRSNRSHPAAQGVPAEFDSQNSQAAITWLERGPVRATVKVVHTWPKLRFECRVSLQTGQPYVHARIRLQADIPPPPGEGKINGWQFPLEIQEGYWLCFAPAFNPIAVVRDYPFGVEACAKDAIDSLNFIDLVGAEAALLIVHSGTQYFKRSKDGIFSNLLIREWNSHFKRGQYGWPRDAEYQYRLMPHGREFSNADRLAAVESFDQHLICINEPMHEGRLAKQQSFAAVDGSGVLISSLRAVGNGAYELRLIEQHGAPAKSRVTFSAPVQRYAECDHLGNVTSEFRPLENGGFDVALGAWQIKTLRIERA